MKNYNQTIKQISIIKKNLTRSIKCNQTMKKIPIKQISIIKNNQTNRIKNIGNAGWRQKLSHPAEFYLL